MIWPNQMLGFFSESYPVDPRLSQQLFVFVFFFVGNNKTDNFSLFPFFLTVVSKNFIILQVKLYDPRTRSKMQVLLATICIHL